MKTVYSLFCTDVIHKGHLNIIAEAQKYGELTVGVLADRDRIRFNRYPLLDLDERVRLIERLDGVSRVIVQETMDYAATIASLRPDYIIHGDNWQTGAEQRIRQNVLLNLAKYGGELIEIPYTFDPEAMRIDQIAKHRLAMPEHRRASLRKLLQLRDIVKIMEAHSGLTGLIVEKTIVDNGETLDQFDGMWLSSLCDSTSRGKPDIELVSMYDRMRTVDEIMEVTTKPLIVDGDTGGLAEHFAYNVRSLERMGVSAIIIEDKKGLKRNSLFGTEVKQTQEDIEPFCEKIRAGKHTQRTADFMIIARIESLILQKGLEDALTRAKAYVAAGADGIMIHSREKTPDEVFQFARAFRKENKTTPLVVVPTAYSTVYEKELIKEGINIVIYANQQTRAAYRSMQNTVESILTNGRAYEVEQNLVPFKEIISLIDIE